MRMKLQVKMMMIMIIIMIMLYYNGRDTRSITVANDHNISSNNVR